MFRKAHKRGLNIAIAVILSSVGTVSYIPTAYAEGIGTVQTSQVSTSLSKLEVQGVQLDKTFSPDVKEYTAVVDNSIEAISLLLESNNQAAKIKVNNQAVTSGEAASYSLETGENNFLIELNDGTSSSTYTLIITREQSGNNLLQGLTLSSGELSPAFSPTVTDYTVEVPNSTSSLTVTPTADEKTSKVSVNNSTSSESGIKVQLPVGMSAILIVVTAEDGGKKTYSLYVTREASTETSNSTKNNNNNNNNSSGPSSQPQNNNSGSNYSSQGNGNGFSNTSFGTNGQQISETQAAVSKAKLSTLTVSAGTWDSDFTTDEYTYHVAVAADAKTITITPTASNSSSDILIDGGTSKSITLEDDNKTIIPIVVSYDDTDRKTYVLIFDRQ